jgi:uncharacterized protein YndB with AHSA1/START domain
VSVTTDRMLVRAPVGVVYAVLTDIDGWHRWWRGCRTERIEDRSGDRWSADGQPSREQHLVVIGPRWTRRARIVSAHGWRHDVGMHLELRERNGRPAGDVEVWLEACSEGTIVHHLLRGVPHARRRDAQRRAVRLGLQDLKDHLELVVDIALGRVP